MLPKGGGFLKKKQALKVIVVNGDASALVCARHFVPMVPPAVIIIRHAHFVSRWERKRKRKTLTENSLTKFELGLLQLAVKLLTLQTFTLKRVSTLEKLQKSLKASCTILHSSACVSSSQSYFFFSIFLNRLVAKHRLLVTVNHKQQYSCLRALKFLK